MVIVAGSLSHLVRSSAPKCSSWMSDLLEMTTTKAAASETYSKTSQQPSSLDFLQELPRYCWSVEIKFAARL